MIHHTDLQAPLTSPFTNCSVHVDSGEESKNFEVRSLKRIIIVTEVKLTDDFWRRDRKTWVPNLDASIWDMDVLIWSIKPIGPHDECLIGLRKKIEEQRGRHIIEDDPL